ncbi:hypothetical protein DS831_04555 [Bombilactobacillus bombi]|uniref:Exodeoxyribonuclease X-like C-terminal domain-containing protein n=1 Tax=Bombilactobacillus bombi TaxID=1303590 RepID=A0A417ZHX5_9LACO|nr:hypothetical protein [Bombilactobacillus bombi]RHW51297.1 hypothetical protein DS831_04555 [Bombilactobacillus bombi]
MQEVVERAEHSPISIIENLDMGSVQGQLQSIKKFQTIVNESLVEEQDYGVIPGTQKPTLLKPGAEKILMLLGLTSEYKVIDKVEDYDEGFFVYTVEASLYKNNQLITQGLGSANTKENRYKNQNAYTLQNTVLKMAKKRAQVDATLTVGSLSNVFTQDIEDIKDFNRREQMETMNSGDAGSMKVTFGKYKGQTLGEIFKQDKSYLEWLKDNAKKPEMKQAAEMVLNGTSDKQESSSRPKPEHKSPTKKQLEAIEDLFEKLSSVKQTSKQEILSENKIKDLNSLNTEQATRFIKKLQKDLDAAVADNMTEIAMTDNDLPF